MSIEDLVKRYEKERDLFRKPNYNESQLRVDFLDAFFELFGWDVSNKSGKPSYEREVLVEEGLKAGAGANTKKPDYTFRLFSERKFFAEAKKPSVAIEQDDATKINPSWIKEHLGDVKIDAVLCDLGLSGFPKWEQVIDNLVDILAPNGKIVIMDWYMEKLSLRGEFINWIGKGEVNRPIWQYLQTKVEIFEVKTFKRGDVFVATGQKHP